MLKNLFLLALLATLGFLGWRHFTATPPASTPPPTPEQEVAALVGQSVIPAGELAAICSKYPKLVTKELKGKTVAVSGLLHKAMVSGIKSNDLTLEFVGTQNLKFMFRSDFGRKERWGGPAGMRFQKKGKEILADKIAERVVCREGETITLRGEFRHIGSGWVKFDLLEMP